jgi:hypothetical protein
VVLPGSWIKTATSSSFVNCFSGRIREKRSEVPLEPGPMAKLAATAGLVELPHLASFATVAEQGSFTAAANFLGITQAAVSQRIAMLEGELRISLFDRRAGRISLTEAGPRLCKLPHR